MRQRTFLLSALAGVSALALLQCSLTEDLDSLTRGGPAPLQDAALPEATPGVDAAPPAADTGGAHDAAPAPTPGVDAAPDANPDVFDAGPANDPPRFPDGGAAVTWCSGHGSGSFCADFDRTPLPSGFSSVDGVLVTLTSTLASSAPNTLMLLAPPAGGSGFFSSKVSKSFGQVVTSVSVAFDFRPEILNTTSSGVLFAAVDFVDNTNAKYSVRLAYNEGAARLEESYLGAGADTFHSSFDLPAGAWAKVRLELSFGGSGGDAGADGGGPTSAVYVGDKLIARDPIVPPPNVVLRPTLLLGAVYGTLPHTGWLFRYDNVTVDLQ